MDSFNHAVDATNRICRATKSHNFIDSYWHFRFSIFFYYRRTCDAVSSCCLLFRQATKSIWIGPFRNDFINSREGREKEGKFEYLKERRRMMVVKGWYNSIGQYVYLTISIFLVHLMLSTHPSIHLSIYLSKYLSISSSLLLFLSSSSSSSSYTPTH